MVPDPEGNGPTEETHVGMEWLDVDEPATRVEVADEQLAPDELQAAVVECRCRRVFVTKPPFLSRSNDV